MQSFNLLRCIQKLWIQLFSWTQWIIYMMLDIAGTVFLNKDTASYQRVVDRITQPPEAVDVGQPQVVWSCQRLEENLLITCCVLTTCYNFTCGRGWGCVWCCCQYWGICRIRKYCDHQCHKMYHQTCHQYHQWIWWFTEICKFENLSQTSSPNLVIHWKSPYFITKLVTKCCDSLYLSPNLVINLSQKFAK